MATYYVRLDGSDSNDGTADDAAHAWLTSTHAVATAPSGSIIKWETGKRFTLGTSILDSAGEGVEWDFRGAILTSTANIQNHGCVLHPKGDGWSIHDFTGVSLLTLVNDVFTYQAFFGSVLNTPADQQPFGNGTLYNARIIGGSDCIYFETGDLTFHSRITLRNVKLETQYDAMFVASDPSAGSVAHIEISGEQVEVHVTGSNQVGADVYRGITLDAAGAAITLRDSVIAVAGGPNRASPNSYTTGIEADHGTVTLFNSRLSATASGGATANTTTHGVTGAANLNGVSVSGINFTTASANPLTLPTGNGRCCAFSPDGAYYGVGHATTPFMSIYAVDPITGLGTKLANPVTLPSAQVNSLAWSPDGTMLAIGTGTTGEAQLMVYNFSAGIGSVISLGVDLPVDSSTVLGVCWSPDNTRLFFTSLQDQNATGPVGMIRFSGNAVVVGSLTYSDPAGATLTGTGSGVAITPAGDYVFIGYGISPFVLAWKVSDIVQGVSFASPLANPASLPAGAGKGIVVHPSGSYVFLSHTTTPFGVGYNFAAGWGTKINLPVALAGNGTSVAVTPDGLNVGFAHTTTPFSKVFPFAAGVVGTAVANPDTLPAGNGSGIAFHPSAVSTGNYSVGIANTTTPFERFYVGTALPTGPSTAVKQQQQQYNLIRSNK